MSTVKVLQMEVKLRWEESNFGVFKTTKFRRKLPTKEVIIKVSAILFGWVASRKQGECNYVDM